MPKDDAGVRKWRWTGLFVVPAVGALLLAIARYGGEAPPPTRTLASEPSVKGPVIELVATSSVSAALPSPGAGAPSATEPESVAVLSASAEPVKAPMPATPSRREMVRNLPQRASFSRVGGRREKPKLDDALSDQK
jgi:hypothetical protein